MLGPISHAELSQTKLSHLLLPTPISGAVTSAVCIIHVCSDCLEALMGTSNESAS